ncbi:conserved hypothetical protein [uncultured Sporomusa sp.]|uniref:Uncharacterized protein n=1 Tax=uncultured Sporomusa sp. TaxID=307249 RepID=A0A212LNC4_9FIRM|nr:hypothetical protein [uncultured Sporomusa sp.]SCM79033.1 conserved hypothetical protein [uncultured Sporomusa sp.]
MNKLDDAVVFSKKYNIVFARPVVRPVIEKLANCLIQDIGRPLAHKGVIMGHIKVLAKLTEEEFLFLSLTRMDRVDSKTSSRWPAEADDSRDGIDLDINVLVFGHDDKTIETVVEDSLAVFRKNAIGYGLAN